MLASTLAKGEMFALHPIDRAKEGPYKCGTIPEKPGAQFNSIKNGLKTALKMALKWNFEKEHLSQLERVKSKRGPKMHPKTHPKKGPKIKMLLN